MAAGASAATHAADATGDGRAPLSAVTAVATPATAATEAGKTPGTAETAETARPGGCLVGPE